MSPRDAQTPASSPAMTREKKARRPGRRDRAIAASVRQHISSVAEANNKANARRERALLLCIDELRFIGDVIIQSRDDAIIIAKEASRPRSNECEVKELVFYVLPWYFKPTMARNGKNVFPLPRGSDAFTAEMAAIAEGLAVALSQTLTDPAKIHRLVIFSDCREALSRVNEVRQRRFSEELLLSEANSVLRKLITRSQYFRRIGISIELRWAEDDSGGPGFTNGVYLDEGLHFIELQVKGKGREDRVVKPKGNDLSSVFLNIIYS
ncbi:hypothetical protein LA080_014937 [Diaporthe eres]|nr:hypothetical protein LA080_014937 [Diaporthe eres]